MSERYCHCKRPNTRQIAYARADAFECPDCGKRLDPDPTAETARENTETASGALEPVSRPLSPDSYPSTFSALRSEQGFTPPPSATPALHQGTAQADTEDRNSSQWPTPPPVEQPSQVRARTPTRLIEIDPDDITTVNIPSENIHPSDNRDQQSIENHLLSDHGDDVWDRLDGKIW